MFQKQQWKQHVHTERTGGWKGNKYIELLTEEDWKDFYDKDNLRIWKVKSQGVYKGNHQPQLKRVSEVKNIPNNPFWNTNKYPRYF
jgi:hypothetical protein